MDTTPKTGLAKWRTLGLNWAKDDEDDEPIGEELPSTSEAWNADGDDFVERRVPEERLEARREWNREQKRKEKARLEKESAKSMPPRRLNEHGIVIKHKWQKDCLKTLREWKSKIETSSNENPRSTYDAVIIGSRRTEDELRAYRRVVNESYTRVSRENADYISQRASRRETRYEPLYGDDGKKLTHTSDKVLEALRIKRLSKNRSTSRNSDRRDKIYLHP
eukprot:TRINITY_DN362_c0_g1_i5.p1 TRINITY_DN362_c0_g1~~TRINITY_DN362_c0_g1_i5.p1  ORF type:complete len:221 (+),score=42.76 TRINITY_DN362_c0_g1_i5:54-716(+)